MSLERYASKRMVVQTPNTTVYDAVRAMEANHIGVVVVHDGEDVKGLVTDRDLALRVIGNDGKINIFNAFGQTDVLVDVLGYAD